MTLHEYRHELEHAAELIVRLERSIETSIETLPAKMRAVVEALQSLRGVAQTSAVWIVAELGAVSRFARAWQLMGHSGPVPWGTRVATEFIVAASVRRATRICGVPWWKPPDLTGTAPP